MKEKLKIKKAVFPVAGMGTRFLPATKAMPKEMLPVVDKPLIQYAVEEALASGIEQLIFVTGKKKEALEDHFDHSCEIEHTLMARDKHQLLEEIQNLVPESGTIVYTRQSEPLGLGHAIWCARDVVGNEPFAVLLADDLVRADKPVLSQMVEHFDELQSSMVAIIEVDPDQTDKYGILDADPPDNGITRARALVEKPSVAEAPSNLAIIGRYILTPDIFRILDNKTYGAGGEIQITDAMQVLLKNEKVYGYLFEGTRFDCGDKAGFQMANIAYAMEREDIRARLTPFLQKILASYTNEGG